MALNLKVDLQVGASYRTEGSVPLLRHHSPVNIVMESMRPLRVIPPGTRFTVIEEFDKRGYPWYKVTSPSGDGWVSGIALVGQSLAREERSLG